MGPGAAGRSVLTGSEADARTGPGRLSEARPVVLRWLVLLYLILLPVGLFYVVPVAGAAATGTDVLLGGLVAAGLLTLAWRLVLGAAASDAPPFRSVPSYGSYAPGAALLVLFGLWATLSALWGYHGDYALAKGVGYATLAVGAACIGWSGVRWSDALDAWLAGTALVMAATLLLLAVGPDPWSLRVAYGGGSIRGLPLPRLRGPFLHPNGFGDYLLLSGVFLWARWPAWTSREGPSWRRVGAGILLGTLALFLLLTVSTAWLAGGVLLLFWGRRVSARAKRAGAPRGGRIRGLGLRALGATVVGATLAGLVATLQVGLGPLSVTTGGVRPRIWASAARAVLDSPILGVGAAPYLAEAVDPLNPRAGLQLWDAHDVYLSVMGQFGLVGFGLMAAGVWFLWRRLGEARSAGGPERWRGRTILALKAALLAMAIHGLVISGEDFRHWWAVVGMVGLVGGEDAE